MQYISPLSVFSILQGNGFAFYLRHQQQDPPCPHNPVQAAGVQPSGGSAGRDVSVEAVVCCCPVQPAGMLTLKPNDGSLPLAPMTTLFQSGHKVSTPHGCDTLALVRCQELERVPSQCPLYPRSLVAQRGGFQVCPFFVGHGIGSYFHGHPEVWHHGKWPPALCGAGCGQHSACTPRRALRRALAALTSIYLCVCI